MTMLARWDHVRHADDGAQSVYAREALKIAKGVAIAAAIMAATIAIVAIRVYFFVPGLRW